MRRFFGPGTNVPTRSCLLLILLPMFAAAAVLKVVFSFIPAPRPDMVPEADGLVLKTTVEDAQTHTRMPIALPNDLLGAEVYAVGAYTEGTPSLPVGSAIVVLARDGQRIAEIIERPDTTLADTTAGYGLAESEEVVITDPANPRRLLAKARFLTLPSKNVRCVSRNEKWDLPGFCEIRRLLAFESQGVTYTIAADQGHATDGELLTLARGILVLAAPEPATPVPEPDPTTAPSQAKDPDPATNLAP